VDINTSASSSIHLPETLRLLRAEAMAAYAKALTLCSKGLDPTALDHLTTLLALEPSDQVRKHLARGRDLLSAIQ